MQRGKTSVRGCGRRQALPRDFGRFLALGITVMVVSQALINVGVVLGMMPTKGIPLPFVSYGGSNLTACLFGIGLLLNIYRQGVLEPANQKRTIIQARTTPRI